MADTIPGLLDRLSGGDVNDQCQAASQLGDLARTVAQQSPADLPQLEPAVPLLAGLLSSDILDSQLAAAQALKRFCRSSPDLAGAVGRSGAAGRSAALRHQQPCADDCSRGPDGDPAEPRGPTGSDRGGC